MALSRGIDGRFATLACPVPVVLCYKRVNKKYIQKKNDDFATDNTCTRRVGKIWDPCTHIFRIFVKPLPSNICKDGGEQQKGILENFPTNYPTCNALQ